MIKNTTKTAVILCVLLGLNACDHQQPPLQTQTQTQKSSQQISQVIEPIYLNDDSYQVSSQIDGSSSQKRIEVPLLNQELDGDLQQTTQSKIISESILNQAIPSDHAALQAEMDEKLLEHENQIADAVAAVEKTIEEPTFAKPITDSRSPFEKILESILDNNDAIDYINSEITQSEQLKINGFCRKISRRLSSVSMENCLAAKHRLSPFSSNQGEPIVVTEFAPKPERRPLGRVLVIGGTHGDELTAVSTSYKWINNLNKFHSGLFHWHIAPAINPDGLFVRPATRTNANGIDINRHLPTPDWKKQSIIHWEKSGKDARKNPGTEPASEPEAKWIIHEIATFKPDVIISVHAPYGVLDFDSPVLKNAPRKFGQLKLNLLGTYPGSLGNYAGIEQKIPVLTLELPNATTMPDKKELVAIWGDMIRWLKRELKKSAN